MSDQYYGPTVRIRREASKLGGDDLVLEMRQELGRVSDPSTTGPRWPFPTYQWVEKKRVNEMSNDFAFDECDREARELRKQVVEREFAQPRPAAPLKDRQGGPQEGS